MTRRLVHYYQTLNLSCDNALVRKDSNVAGSQPLAKIVLLLTRGASYGPYLSRFEE